MLSPSVRTLGQKLLPRFLLRRLDPFLAAIEDFLHHVSRELPSGARLLDAGAGEAQYKRLFPQARYVALDHAKGDPSWNYASLDVIGDLEQLPFLDGAFDKIISIVVLEHVQEPLRAMEEFRRVLKPAGRAHLVVPMLWEEHQKPHDYFRFTSNGVRWLLERARLRPVEIAPVGGFFWVMGRRSVTVLTFFQGGWKWIVFAMLVPVFGLLLPLACYYLDKMFRNTDFTLGFRVVAEK